MTARMLLAIIGAPLLAAAAYATQTLSSVSNATIDHKPAFLGLLIPGAIACGMFELVVLVPLLLVLRKRRQLSAALFIGCGVAVWLATWFLAMLVLGVGVLGSSATAAAAFLPGVILAVGFWFMAGGRSGA